MTASPIPSWLNPLNATVRNDARQTCLNACPLMGFPPRLIAARRAAFVAKIEAATPKDIAVAVARYNVAHVSAKNKAWAERRLQEELAKTKDNAPSWCDDGLDDSIIGSLP